MKARRAFLLIVSVLCLALGPEPILDPYPNDEFRLPLNIPIYLSGNFAEMRDNHFHAGLDMKTNAKEGYRVYAAASGSVARIAVSPTGYGNALYINHPNGYTTVYAHLQRFNPAITEYVKAEQYKQEKFAVNLYPPAGLFSLEQGDVIAFSGNSGSSGGPHLHFEIRDRATQWPINPLLFGLDITDTIAPQFFTLKLYPADAASYALVHRANGKSPELVTHGKPLALPVVGSDNGYRLRGVQRIEVYGSIGFGAEIKDFHNGSQSRLGAYRVQILANESPLFQHTLETFGFDITRYLNAHVDYGERQENRRWIQRGHVLPGNRLPIYETNGNQGFLTTETDQTYRIQYQAEDAYGQTSVLSFEVNGIARTRASEGQTSTQTVLPHGTASSFTRPGLRVMFDRGTFYEDVALDYARTSKPRGTFAPLHMLHERQVPVHKRYTLSIQAEGLPPALRSKALLIAVDDDGDWSSLGGSYADGFVTARPRSFGAFTVAVDTTAPTIRPLNIKNNMRGVAALRIRASDNLSGIRSYNGYIDGQWRLFAYDAKRRRFTHTFDERTAAGQHTLRFVVEDQKGNRAEYTTTFTR